MNTIVFRVCHCSLVVFSVCVLFVAGFGERVLIGCSIQYHVCVYHVTIPNRQFHLLYLDWCLSAEDMKYHSLIGVSGLAAEIKLGSCM